MMGGVSMDEVLLVALALVLIIGVEFLTGPILNSSRNKAWQEFATRTGLKFRKDWLPLSEPNVKGTYRDYLVSVDAQKVWQLRTRDRITVIKVAVKNAGNNFLELDKGWLNTNFLAQKFEIGDVEFDRRIYATTNSPDFARRVLSSVELRGDLQKAIAFQIVLRNNQLTLKDSVILSEVNYLTFLLNLMTDLAKEIDNYQSS
jgi:hypothetical protein